MDVFEGEPLLLDAGFIKYDSYSVLISFTNQVDIFGKSKLIFLTYKIELKKFFAV